MDFLVYLPQKREETAKEVAIRAVARATMIIVISPTMDRRRRTRNLALAVAAENLVAVETADW